MLTGGAKIPRVPPSAEGVPVVPLPASDVTGYRDWLLARTRQVQRGATVSAVVAAVALSAVFAHVLPGHHAAARAATAAPSQRGAGSRAAPHAGHHHAAHSRRHHHLQ